MNDHKKLQLEGRVFITGIIVAKSGLHIGGSGGSFSIGGNDNPVIVNPMNGEPYIPGSSLRGKMRSLTEKYMGVKLVRHANITMHTAENEEDYKESPIANIYGVPAQDFNLPSRLIVRDVMLTSASREQLLKARTDLPFTEVKTEVSIDRITSQANPRSLERVPAGAEFGPMEMVYNLYIRQDVDWFSVLVDGMTLLEDDYLGGSGSRGSGKVAFKDLTITIKPKNDYRNPQPVQGNYDTLRDFSNDLENILKEIKQRLFQS
ncbi:MAG: type III-A CRISPR-associated RAMP protein Csm3 [Anaerolineae bacterium]|jgi:CRISPR-associated protein Csm3|nr:type III-A CRISPR-associated RAMP protein Csm3 [Anaerolineae bacterium]